jgi:hypothetical protein
LSRSAIAPPSSAVIPAGGTLSLSWPNAGLGALTARVLLGGVQVWPAPATEGSAITVLSASYGSYCAALPAYAAYGPLLRAMGTRVWTLLPHVAALTDERSAAAVVAANIRALAEGAPLAHLVRREAGY